MKLSYSLNTPYINVDVNFGLKKINNAISNYYQWQELNGDRVIVSKPENCDYMLDYGFKGAFQITPFKSDILFVPGNRLFMAEGKKVKSSESIIIIIFLWNGLVISGKATGEQNITRGYPVKS